MSWWGGSSDAGAKEPAKEEVWDLTSHDGIDEDQYALDSASSSVNHDPFADELSGEDTSSMDFTHSVGNRVSDVYEGLHSMPAAPMPTEGRVAESAGAGRGGGAAGLLGGLNPAALQAMAAQQQQQQQGGQDRFLQQSRKGLWEVTMHNVGVTYLSGGCLPCVPPLRGRPVRDTTACGSWSLPPGAEHLRLLQARKRPPPNHRRCNGKFLWHFRGCSQSSQASSKVCAVALCRCWRMCV